MGFGLLVIAEKMKIYSYLHIVENPYPQDDFYMPEDFKFLCSRISFTELERWWIIKYSVCYQTVPILT